MQAQLSSRRELMSLPAAQLYSILLLLFLHLPSASIAQCSAGCFPTNGNLASGRTVQGDSTCSSGAQFCISNFQDCFTCDADSTHSISNINDGNNGTAWISTIGPNSTQTTLQLNFESLVLFNSMTILWKSVRPQSMVLERSRDGGSTWLAYRFYSASCMATFMETQQNVFPGVQFNSTDAICTASESQLNPTSNGEVTFDTSQHLPLNTTTTASTEYRLVTNLRLRLIAQFPELELQGLEYQYYSIGEWTVRGSCMCNGHADTCAPVAGETLIPGKLYSGCVCQHSTAGTHCDQCLVGFNSLPWEAGTNNDANACQECMCFGHARDCEPMTGSTQSQCIDCTDNTEGSSCDVCRLGYYQNESALLNDVNICIDCGCDLVGTAGGSECDSDGQCNCKTNVEGLQCTECREGFWNRTAENVMGCQECSCDSRGTVSGSSGRSLCDQTTGLCRCLMNIGGDSCDICDDGYYDLDQGCISCDCSQAGSTGPVCDKDSSVGQCSCLPNVGGSKCTTPLEGYYFKHLDDIIFEAEDSILSQGVSPVYPLLESGLDFTGRGLVSFPPTGYVVFTVQVPYNSTYEVILRLQSAAPVDSISIIIESTSPVQQNLDCFTTNSIVNRHFGPFTLTPSLGYHTVGTVCMVTGTSYTVRLEYSEFSVDSQGWLLDSLLLMPDFSSTSAFYASQVLINQQDLVELCLPRSVALSGSSVGCREVAFSLSLEFYGQVFECDCSPVGTESTFTCSGYGGECACLDGVTGRQCDVCQNGRFNFTNNGCEVCNCDTLGAVSPVCDFNTGLCDCQQNVEGQTCNTCTAGFFNLSASGCTDCTCSNFSISVQCSDSSQCPCPPGVGGVTCDQCLPETYNITRGGCTDCACSGVGIRSSSNDCDTVTGQCPCINNAVTRNCAECPSGFFETDGSIREVCVKCVCSGQTETCSNSPNGFALASAQSDFTVLCAENPIACDDGWLLVTADGQQAAPYGPSDSSGLGYVLLNNNNPMLYAPEKFLGNYQSAYGLYFTMSISLSTTAPLKSTFIRLTSSFLSEALVGVFPAPTLMDVSSFNRMLTFTIPLKEEYWLVGSLSGPTASFSQFYSTLSDITELSVSGEFTEDFIEFVRIQSITLNVIVPQDTAATQNLSIITTPFPVEQCTCPNEYTGRICQQCARGHARLSGNPTEPCIECNCNNLTLDCDVSSGICINCTGNSEGSNCELCLPGFYGDPTQGIPCLPCSCPILTNSFSPTCFLDTDLSPTCDSCAPGYTGRTCEVCMDGFFGNPLVGHCTTCECNGNIDPALGPVCDMVNGRCLNCLNNTQGFECDSCIPGYYGDPPSGQRCQPCECHLNGTQGFCDSLFGTCTCLSNNILGELCDECRDEYWGLSQGFLCIPCNCCSNGSSSNICDKESGRCSCNANIGSAQDDKCCDCTPGYFNFTPEGCQACNCSELSISEECDAVTGQCQCQEGAIGIKCDDCAFGYFGAVPNCQQCHECYYQWYYRVQDISTQVNIIETRVQLLVELNYNGFTVESIMTDVQQLLDQLAYVNATLQNISLDSSDIDELNDTLEEISNTLLAMSELVIEIELQLSSSAEMLARVLAFDGTVNETSLSDLLSEIELYNNSIIQLAAIAEQHLQELMTNQQQTNNLWMDIEEQDEYLYDLLANASAAKSNIDRANMLEMQLHTEYEALRLNLTSLSMKANTLHGQLALLNATAVNSTYMTEATGTTVQELLSSLQGLREQADMVLNLTQQLIYYTNTTQTASQQLVESTASLLGALSAAQQAAQNVSTDIDSGITAAEALKLQLESTKNLAEQILNLTLPSVEVAEQLASSINSSILSSDQVDEIVANATGSSVAAQQALGLAQNASLAVAATHTLIESLRNELNSTTAGEENIGGTLTYVRQKIRDISQNVSQIENLTATVNTKTAEVEQILDNVSQVVDDGTQTGMESQVRSQQIRNQAIQDAERSDTYQNNVDQAISNLQVLEMNVERERNQSESVRQEAANLANNAQQIQNNANEVSLDQLKALLAEYMSETAVIESLKSQVQSLEEELRLLTSSFTETAQRLNTCYETP